MSDQERLEALLEDWAQANGLDDGGVAWTLTHFIMVSGNTDRFAAYLRGLEADAANEEGIGWPEWAWCNEHGRTIVIDGGDVEGFTGAPIYWIDLQCGCQRMDASEDTLERMR